MNGSIEQNLYQLHTIFLDKKENYKVAIKTSLINILFCLLNSMDTSIDSFREMYNKQISDIQRIQPLLIYIKDHIDSDIPIDHAIKQCNMSESYFCHFFKRVVGTTFTEYVIDVRIDRAKELLQQHHLGCEEIAYTVGFQNYTYFYRCFKKRTGISPKTYLKFMKTYSN